MIMLQSGTSCARRSVLAHTSLRGIATTSMRGLAATAGASGTSGPWADRLSSPHLNRYLVVAEDYSDAGANARRFEVRERHLEQAQNGKRAGRIELGGALLRKDFSQIDEDVGPGPHMAGSVLVVLGESVEDVRNRVMQDEYIQGNVWDVSKLKIYPFLQAPLVSASTTSDASSELNNDASSRSAVDSNATLGQLRQDLAAGKGPKMVTLGALRNLHQNIRRTSEK